MGVAEMVIVGLLLSLGGLGGDAKSPKPPPTSEIMRCAPASAEAMVYWHGAAAIPAFMSSVDALKKNKHLKTLPEAKAGIAKAIGWIEQSFAKSKQKFGVDPLKDLIWMAGWGSKLGSDAPEAAVILRGSLGRYIPGQLKHGDSRDTTPITIGTARGTIDRDGRIMVVTADKRYMLGGTREWITECLARTKAPTTPLTRHASRLLTHKPYIMGAVRPSEQMRTLVAQLDPSPNTHFIRSLVAGQRAFGFAISPTSLHWDWEGVDERQAHVAEVASVGVVELLRAGQHALRGVARLAMATLHSYKGQHPWVDWALENESFLMDVVFAHTGDGKFDAKVVRKGLFVTANAKAKHVNQILPAAAVMMGGVIGVIWASTSQKPDDSPASSKEATPRRKIRTRGLPPGDQSPDGLQPIPTP